MRILTKKIKENFFLLKWEVLSTQSESNMLSMD